MKKVLLWLDDLRNPFLDLEDKVPLVDYNEIHWVLNYNEFIQYIVNKGLPEYISFDHDLAPEHYTPEKYWIDYQVSKAYQESQIYKERTGLDCAKFLIEYCVKTGKKLPKYFCHSANPVGKDNILDLLNNYISKVEISNFNSLR